MLTMNSKKEHDQKYYLKKICQLLHKLGMGEFWYERMDDGNVKCKLYIVWALVANAYIFMMMANEMLAHVRIDLTDGERGDLILFSCAHPSIAGKILVLYAKRGELKNALRMLVEVNRDVRLDTGLDKYSVRRAKIYCTCLLVNIYIILTSATIEGIKNHLEEGVPIRTEVTLVPANGDTGFLVNVFRFFIQLHWWLLISVMYSIDSLSICTLVFLGHKFRTVRLHFDECRIIVTGEYKAKTRKELDESYRRNFVVGIKLHRHALSCARQIQNTLGGLYSVQVCESISMLVICLLKLTIAGRNVTSVIKNLTFISCVILLNGTYMVAGGDVTHEASLVSDSLFHCGWEYAKAGGPLRRLFVITLQRSQVPIRMTAFGVLSLSYNSFITVLRLSYSFFAVMYQTRS